MVAEIQKKKVFFPNNLETIASPLIYWGEQNTPFTKTSVKYGVGCSNKAPVIGQNPNLFFF